jgi:hypothetical protein
MEKHKILGKSRENQGNQEKSGKIKENQGDQEKLRKIKENRIK